jgi:hypothetical protein
MTPAGLRLQCFQIGVRRFIQPLFDFGRAGFQQTKICGGKLACGARGGAEAQHQHASQNNGLHRDSLSGEKFPIENRRLIVAAALGDANRRSIRLLHFSQARSLSQRVHAIDDPRRARRER